MLRPVLLLLLTRLPLVGQADRSLHSRTEPFVHAGQNHLRVEFTPAPQAEQALAPADKAEADQHIPNKAYLCKAAYEFGRDWGPRFITSEVLRPVRIESWNNLGLDDVYVRQLDGDEAAALPNLRIRPEAAQNGPAEIAVRYGVDANQKTATQLVEVHAGVNEVFLPSEAGASSVCADGELPRGEEQPSSSLAFIASARARRLLDLRRPRCRSVRQLLRSHTRTDAGDSTLRRRSSADREGAEGDFSRGRLPKRKRGLRLQA